MTSIDTWFYSLPPVTRYYLAANTVITVLVSLKVVSVYSVIFNPMLIKSNFEIWRFLTSFCFFGSFDFSWLFSMAYLVISTRSLELMPMFVNNPKSFYWMILCEVVIIWVFAWFLQIYLLGEILVFAFLYLICRYEPDRVFRLLWGFEVKAVHLPFVIMGFGVLQGGSIVGNLIGLAIGESAYLAKETVPEKYGYDLLSPPQKFCDAVDWAAARLFPNRPEARGQPEARRQNVGFQGRGYRLG